MKKHYEPKEGDSDTANEVRNILSGLYNVLNQLGGRHAALKEEITTWVCYYEAELKAERSKKKARFIP